ncbi:hypothetical protein [Streptomyces cacaoi]|uniref:hypothetical protein n=1 Tax=Streptomyces cacaoi TaxID=1898 RepID=UPI002628C17D|nr:hypothetical protein [Streptomyces cacaoi]
MQNKPIDTGRLGTIRCALAPEPRTTPDGDVRRDREGRPQWVTGLMVRQVSSRRTEVIHVVTTNEPHDVEEGALVDVADLWASDWAVDGRTGTSYRAEAITPAAASTSGVRPDPKSRQESAPVAASRKGGES